MLSSTQFLGSSQDPISRGTNYLGQSAASIALILSPRVNHVDAFERLNHPNERTVDPLNTFTSRVEQISLDLGAYDITEPAIFHQNNNFAYLEKNTAAEKSYPVFETPGLLR